MSLQAVIQLMTDLNDVHNTLLELGEQKKHALIHNQVDQLTQIVSKENKLIKQVGELDQERIRVIGEFLIEKGYKPNPKVTVSDLTKIIFNVEEKKNLQQSQKQLMGTIHKLREMNQLNQQLVEYALSFVNYSLDLFYGPPEDEVIYHNPQQQNYGPRRQGLFDTRG